MASSSEPEVNNRSELRRAPQAFTETSRLRFENELSLMRREIPGFDEKLIHWVEQPEVVRSLGIAGLSRPATGKDESFIVIKYKPGQKIQEFTDFVEEVLKERPAHAELILIMDKANPVLRREVTDHFEVAIAAGFIDDKYLSSTVGGLIQDLNRKKGITPDNIAQIVSPSGNLRPEDQLTIQAAELGALKLSEKAAVIILHEDEQKYGLVINALDVIRRDFENYRLVEHSA